MLDAPRYLLGVAEIAVLVGFALLAGAALRARLLPDFSGAPARLATAVLALAILIWTAELLGTFGLFEPLPYLVAVALAGVVLWRSFRGWCGGGHCLRSPRGGGAHPRDKTRGHGVNVISLIAFAVAIAAIVNFAADVRVKLGTGMTGFDSTWYHGPFAAGFFQGGDTWGLHFIAPQFLAWFYPANAELFHGMGMLAFGRDIVSPLLNLGWFVGCLAACWCIGRPYRVAPWSLALGAIALSVPALGDQAGEARNDIVGVFFLLAAVAVALNDWTTRPAQDRGLPTGALLVVGLAAGLCAGTKLNFLLPAVTLVVGLAIAAPRGARWRHLYPTALAALAGGGYWYLRNLLQIGNPLPWVDNLGPISLSAPEQALGGREGHSVLGYLTDGSVWSDWFLPGLHDGLGLLWPPLVALALAGLLLCLGRRSDPVLWVSAAAGVAAAFAWLIAPTSASGPEGAPRGFESGLRYLAPALVLGLTLLPAAPTLRARLAGFLRGRSLFRAPMAENSERAAGWGALGASIAVVAAVAIGYPVQRHYLENRYADPSFATPGLNAAFAWSRSVSGARIATTSTRQYPLYGTDLSNHVDFVGVEEPHGGFVAPGTCGTWRRLVNEGHYDYVVTSFDRIEPGNPTYPPTTRWTEGPAAKVILRKPPTVVFELTDRLNQSAC